MLKRASTSLLLPIALSFCLNAAQDSAAPKQALEHVLGTVAEVDSNAHAVTVKEDKTGTSYTILLAETKTLFRWNRARRTSRMPSVLPPTILQAGDRVDVRGLKANDNPNTLAARSVVLMSGRSLQQAHQAQARNGSTARRAW